MSGHAEQEIRRRVLRLAALRRAGRALSSCRLDPPFHDEEARAVRRTLEAVASGEQPPERLRAVDAVLDKMQSGILGMLDGTGLAQLRANLPGIARGHRDEVLALLDVALQAASGGGTRMRLLEYLITLLSAEERDGEWSVACAPASLTPRLAAVCDRVATQTASDDVVEEALCELDAAAVDLHISDDVQAVLREVRRFKESLGERILQPSILRGVVAYNLDVWNRRGQQLDDERTLQRLEEALIDAGEDPITLSGPTFSGTLAAVEFGPATPVPGAPVVGAEAEREHALTTAQRRARDVSHDALAERVVDAIRAHLQGKPPELELESLGVSDLAESLGDVEQRALAPAGGEAPSGPRAVIGLMGATHLLLRADDELLRALGADPDFLRSHWLRHVHEHIRVATNQSIATGDLQLARELAEVKELRVGAAIAELMRGGRRRKFVDPGTGADDESDSRHALIIFFEHRRTRAFAALLAVTLLGLLGWRWSMSAGRTQQLLSEREVELVSPHLLSGYRDGRSGRLFIGHVDASFAKLPPVHRQREGWGIALRVRDTFGVGEVLLYDADLGTAFHSVGDEIRVPVLYEDDYVEYGGR